MSTDALEIGNTLKSAKIAGKLNRPNEVINHFPNLSEIVAEKRRIRRRWQLYRQYEDKMELNRLTNLIHKHIREFRIEKFENDVQEASDSGNVWKLSNRIKGSHNSSIHGRGGVKYDALGKGAAVADCLEDQFMTNDSDDQFRYHYKQVRRGVPHFRNKKIDS